MAVPIRLTLVLSVVCSLTLVVSFNLEPRIPVIKHGSSSSHFGYSVAQHKTIVERPSGRSRNTSWILVGAPKGENLQPATHRSGALFKCPLTTFTNDCQQVHTDGYKNPETGLYNFDYIDDDTLSEPAEDEIKDDQWLGVTLQSQGPGKKVLVCAHRYMHKGSGFQWGFGLCYVLSQNLDILDYLEPCKGKRVDEGHLQFGFCQAGTSGLLLEDEVVLGVPGPYTWRGTVHTSNISDDYLLKDKTQYFGPVTENESPVGKYSYLGYSVAAGRFFGRHTSYVGGAPRANGTGQVVFFSRERIGLSLLNVELILSGEKFASSFGYELLSVDINGDEKDDLVVGAPFYFTNTASGAIYVYMNNENGFTTNHPYTRIEGAEGESRFGSSMTSMGDLNHDGFKDIAVGAPYEGRGVIYIFLGSSDGLIVEPAQVIHAEDMPGVPYNAFGYSLSGGMDLDDNGYPDLVTSAFCSDRVFLIRARPIIDIQTKVESEGQLENIDPSKKGCTEHPDSPETCFSFGACFKMDNSAGTRTVLRLKYTIEERVYKDRPIPRVRFSDGLKEKPSVVERDINLRPEEMGEFRCFREIVYLIDGPRNIMRPLRFKLSYEIIQREPRPVSEGAPLPDIDNYPILNQQEALRYFMGTFAKDCGDDDVCESDLHTEGWMTLERNEEDTHYVLRLGEQDTVPLNVEVTNRGEPAYQSSLIIQHHNGLVFEIIESEGGSYQCSRVSDSMLVCGIGNPLTKTTGAMVLTFRESGQPFDTRFIDFIVYTNSSSTEKTPQEPLHFRVEVIKQAEISIIGSVTPEQVFYGGEVVGESAIKHIGEIGSEVTHKYVVDNQGPWRVNELQVEVQWPYQVENGKEKGKWLLYMTDPPIVDGVGECDIDPRWINPLHLRRNQKEFLTGEGEVESTDYPAPTPLEPEDEDEGGTVGGTTSGTKVIKTTTIKKVTNTTTTHKKTTTKTSEKTHRGSSSGTTSSSSSGSYSTSSSGGYSPSSSSDISEDDESNIASGRDHGRTHVRYSRRVSSSYEPGSRFDENNIEGEGDEGTVLEEYDRTRTSSGVSPDGTTRFHESHRETKKVTVKEDGENDIPGGRWGEGGGYRRTYTSSSSSSSSSSSRTRSEEPEGKRVVYESHGGRSQYSQSGAGHKESSDRLNTFEGDQDWKEGSISRRVDSSIHGSQTGDYDSSRGQDYYYRTYGGERRTSHTGETHVSGDTTRTTTEHYGWTDQSNKRDNWGTEGGSHREENVHDREYPERQGEGSYRRTYTSESSRREGSTTGDDYGSHHREENVHRENPERQGEGSYRRTYTYESRRKEGSTTGDDYGSHHREENVHREYPERQGEGSYSRTYESRRREGSSTGDDYGSHHQEENVHREYPERQGEGGYSRTYTYKSSRREGSTTGDGYGSRHREENIHRAYPERQGEGSYSRTYTSRREGSTASTDHRREGSSAGADYGSRSYQGSDVDINDRRSESQWNTRSQGGYRRYEDGRTAGDSENQRQFESHGVTDESGNRKQYFDWNDRSDGDRRTWNERTSTSSRRTYSGHDSHNDGHRQHYADGHESSRHSTGGNFGSYGHSGNSGLRTTTWELGSPQDRSRAHHQGHHVNWDDSQGHRVNPHDSSGRIHYESSGTDETGTYKRVEIDPETGETITYTRRVTQSSDFPENWDRRSDATDSPAQHEEEDVRKRRDLRRIKREKELIIKPQAVTDAETGITMQVVHLKCDGTPTAKCFTFRCSIRNLGAQQSRSIHIRSRLWNSTLVEDYPRVSYVSIKSKASLILPEDIKDDQDQSDDVASAETYAYPDLLDQLPPEEVPLWVILVSIFAGLLVLIIIVLILWKLGFFERKRPDPTLSGNLDKGSNGY